MNPDIWYSRAEAGPGSLFCWAEAAGTGCLRARGIDSWSAGRWPGPSGSPALHSSGGRLRIITRIVELWSTRGDLRIAFPNGSEILFAGLDDVEKLKSIYDITGIWIEEASELLEADFNQLDIRLRTKFPLLPPDDPHLLTPSLSLIGSRPGFSTGETPGPRCMRVHIEITAFSQGRRWRPWRHSARQMSTITWSTVWDSGALPERLSLMQRRFLSGWPWASSRRQLDTCI